MPYSAGASGEIQVLVVSDWNLLYEILRIVIPLTIENHKDLQIVLHLVFYYCREVTTHVVRLKLFRLKAEGGRRAQLPYFGENIWFLHQTWLQNELFPKSLQSSAYPPE